MNFGCTECELCDNCNNSDELISCLACNYCYWCKDCDCCTLCDYCTRTSYCISCYYCTDCYYCYGCKDCSNLSNGIFCKRVKNSSHVIFCIDGTNLDAYSAFDSQVTPTRYKEIVERVIEILPNWQNCAVAGFWQSVTPVQWKALSEIPEFVKSVVETITNIELSFL